MTFTRTTAARTFSHDRVSRVAIVTAAAGLLLTGIGWAIDPRQAAFSYLAAYVFWFSIAIGALFLLMIHHVINASWFVVLRRLAENMADPLIVLAILFLPIAFGIRDLYPWAVPHILDTETARLLERKQVYLNVPFFLIRAVAFFAIWIAISQWLRRWSLAMAEAGAETAIRLARQQRILCAATLPAAGFALTFAAFDWLMSLSPAWYSTVFGVYVFSGGVLAGLSLLALIVFQTRNDARLVGITVSHVHAIGKLLLTFLIFWAYIGYVQLLLVWIANIPVEAAWLALRLDTRWSTLGWVLLIGHFALPLLALLSRQIKRRRGALAGVAAWLLAMHYCDVYWLVLPALYPDGPHPHWLDAAALAAIGGTTFAFALWHCRELPLVPLGDPRLERSTQFVTQ